MRVLGRIRFRTLAASTPFKPGIFKSKRMISGRSSSAILMASRPLAASPTTCRQLFACKNFARIWRTSGLSSTMRIVADILRESVRGMGNFEHTGMYVGGRVVHVDGKRKLAASRGWGRFRLNHRAEFAHGSGFRVRREERATRHLIDECVLACRLCRRPSEWTRVYR